MAAPELEHRKVPATGSGGTVPANPVKAPGAPVVARPQALGGLAAVRRSAAGVMDELGGTAAAPDVVSALRRRQGQGAPLPDDVAGPMGEHMGADFGGVRVHADNEADTIARSVEATAFTHGSDIYFSQGTYQPASESGQKLLAHELAHVAQHRSGADAVSSSGGPVIGRADDPAEAAADRVADGALGALRRRASTATPDTEATGARHSAAAPISRKPATGPAPEIRRWFGSKWFSKKKKPAEEIADAKAEAAAATAATGGAAAVVAAAVPGRSRSSAVSGGPAPLAVPAKPIAAETPTAQPAQVALPAQVAQPATKPAKPPRAPKAAQAAPPTAAEPAEAAAPTAPPAPQPAAPMTATPEAAKPEAATPEAATPEAATPKAAKPEAVTPEAAKVATPDIAPAPPTVAPVTAGPVPDKDKETSPAPVVAPVSASPGDAAPGKTPKEAFTESVAGKAPKDATEAKTRMTELRAMLKAMSASDRESISTDKTLMTKAREFVGTFEYMSLVTAVGMSAKTPKKKGAPDKPKHLSGAQADTFIQSEMGKIGHLKPYLDTAIGAGKKADGFVAVVSDDDWKVIYQQQNGKDADTFGQNTNAFIANTHDDRPAIIHEDRGTPSTAIHESMHRYSVLNTLRTYGSPLNEGMTEYFTRMITDRDGKPLNGKASNRDNYQANYDFISTKLVPMLGSTTVDAQTTLAEIYFSGNTGEIETKFMAKCDAAKLGQQAKENLWKAFSAALKGGNWADAAAKLPPDAPVTAPAKELAPVGGP